MLSDASSFLIAVLIDFYLTILLLRFILQWLKADYYHPISQFTVKLTDPLLKPVRKLIPAIAGIDFAMLSLLMGLAWVENGLLFWLQYGTPPYVVGLALYGIMHILKLGINLFFYAVLIRAILSWLNPHHYSPIVVIITLITEPLLALTRRKLPPIAGIDLSPLLVLVILQMLNLFVVNQLLMVARGLAVVG